MSDGAEILVKKTLKYISKKYDEIEVEELTIKIEVKEVKELLIKTET